MPFALNISVHFQKKKKQTQMLSRAHGYMFMLELSRR